jgi:hypothetical protein
MADRAGPEVEILTIRIPMRLQRCGGRKLIMTPEGAAAAPAPKPRRDPMFQRATMALSQAAPNAPRDHTSALSYPWDWRPGGRLTPSGQVVVPFSERSSRRNAGRARCGTGRYGR